VAFTVIFYWPLLISSGAIFVEVKAFRNHDITFSGIGFQPCLGGMFFAVEYLIRTLNLHGVYQSHRRLSIDDGQFFLNS
jgi:hypothetical protein